MRSDAKKHLKNQSAVSEIKTLDDRLKKLSDDAASAKEAAVRLVSRLDRAVSRGIIPRGRADRKKSRIALFLARIKSPKK